MPNQNKVTKRGPNNIRLVQRRKWDRARIPVVVALEKIKFLSISLVLLFILSCAVLFLLNFPYSNFRTIVIVTLIFLIGAFILAMLMTYLVQTSISYIAESGKIVKFDNEVLDTMQGRIIVRTGLFGKKEKFYGIEEFDRVTVSQGYFDRIFNVGTIMLVQVDKLENTNNVSLPFVKNPSYVARMIQSMIDLEKNNTQAMR